MENKSAPFHIKTKYKTKGLYVPTFTKQIVKSSSVKVTINNQFNLLI